MSKIFVLLLGVAAAELSFTGYTEGSSWHKAVVVSNDGCIDVQLNDYTISMYMNKNTNTNSNSNYQSLTLPVETIASGASFTICNLKASTSNGISSDFIAGCDFFTTGGNNGGLQHNGDDTIVLKKGAATIDTIGEIGEYTFCGSSARYCKDQSCVKTTAGAWGSSAWTCGLPKNQDTQTLSAFVGVSPSCGSGTCSKTNELGSCGSDLHCCHDSGVLRVTHGPTSATEHRCFVTANDECQCECPVLVNCAGSWTETSDNCPAPCGGGSCEATETYTRTANGDNGGDDSCPADGATRPVAGSQETNNNACIPDCVEERLFTVTNWHSANSGSSRCELHSNGQVESKNRWNKNCKFTSRRVAITHPHGYDSLHAFFQYREWGNQDNADYARLRFRTCTGSSASSCGGWGNFITKRNDVNQGGGWSNWKTKTGGERDISPNKKFVEVEVTLKHTSLFEWGHLKNAKVFSNCDAN